MQCKSLWIKASAKCINVNVNVYPQTAAGRIVATLCILYGLLGVSLPVTTIMNNFSKYFDKNTPKRSLSQAKT